MSAHMLTPTVILGPETSEPPATQKFFCLLFPVICLLWQGARPWTMAAAPNSFCHYCNYR
uniref:Uncharacterized protein n=1 Tax=Rhizophora mucronata TaxID=61149 RepID=A0A2P2P6F8_RHIMU